ncbi:MAG TPA: peptidyl-prolyl cis-trans isomerase [Polyangiales bacterium]|jgi:hypothetical protein
MRCSPQVARFGVVLILATPTLASSEASSAPATDSAPLVVATFEAGHITLVDLQGAIDRKSRDVRASIARDDGLAKFLARMIDYDLLALEAERRGYRTQPAVAQALARRSVDRLIAIEEAAATIDPHSPLVDAYFAEHGADFRRTALRRASHIQLADAAAAEALRESLVGANREQFARLARLRSRDDATRKQGGELGFCDAEGRPWQGTAAVGCPPAIAKALFELTRLGEVAPQVIAHDGVFSVLMWTGAMPPKLPTLERTRRKIAIKLSDASREARLESLLTRLRSERPVEAHPELLDSLVLPVALPLDQPAGVPAAPPDPRAPTTAHDDG